MASFLDDDVDENPYVPEEKTDLAEIAFKVEPDEWVDIEELRTMFHAFNSQIRWTYQKEAIAASIRDYGFTGEPIIVNRWNGKILGGHGRVEVCHEHGYRGTLPVIYMNLESETQHRNAMLRLNKARGQQDPVAEHREIMALLEEYGVDEVKTNMAMTPDEINTLLGIAADNVLAPAEFAEYDENIDTQYCCPKCGYSWSGKPK
jgi:hypothetical protein